MADKKTSGRSEREPILLLIDGECNLCHGLVKFVTKRDKREVFRFASLQSPVGQSRLGQAGMRTDAFDTFVMLRRGRIHTKSGAALRVARELGGLWPLLAGLLAVPPFLRDPVYAFIAKRRYRWFGKRGACLLPTPAIRSRFVDEEWGEAGNGR